MRKRLVLPICAAALLTIAASDAAKFYQVIPHRTADAPISVDPTFHPNSGNIKRDVALMQTNGFEAIGYSDFNGRDGRNAVIKQARSVGATDVLYVEKYTGTENAGAIGSTSFSRWGAFSFIAPMNVRRYDQLAVYFRVAPRHGLGTYFRFLTDEEKVQIGSNKGLGVQAVTSGSPAFMYDILPGDIILAVGERPIWDLDSARAAIDAVMGGTTTVTLYRTGQRITKPIFIPAADWSGTQFPSLPANPSATPAQVPPTPAVVTTATLPAKPFPPRHLPKEQPKEHPAMVCVTCQ